MSRLALLLLTASASANAHRVTTPCDVVTTTPGAPYFKCGVKTKSTQTTAPTVFATFSRPFELTTSAGWRLPDTRTSANGTASSFTYYVNPLGALVPTIDFLKGKGCEGTGKDKKNTWNAGAYQLDSRVTDGTGCTRLTGDAAPAVKTTQTTYNGWSAFLLDDEDSSQGIMLKMTGGDQCGPPSSTARSFDISLMCDTAADAQGKSFVEESVSEDQTCNYNIRVETSHGCPNECQAPVTVYPNGKKPGTTDTASSNVCNSKGACRTLADGRASCACTAGDAGTLDSDWVGPGCSFECPLLSSKPCSDAGHCAYEPGLLHKMGSAHCFCNAGFEGMKCETTMPPAKPGTGAPGTLLHPTVSSAAPWVILLVLVFIFCGAWWYHRKEREEPFCCFGNSGMGEGFEDNGNGPPAFSALGGGNSNSYVAPSTESAI